MVKFEELVKTLDVDTRVELYDKVGELIFNGKVRELIFMPDFVLRIIPQSTSREVYLEITTY